MKVLVVDDDAQIREAIAIGLQLQWDDVEVITASDGEDALECFTAADPDLILLDIGLPGPSGFEVLRAIRAVSDAPVLMLTARGDEMDQVRGLELGADDYILKPFGHASLVARIRAVLRRAALPPPARALPDFVAGDLAVDLKERRVKVGGRPVALTPVEYRLLHQFVRYADRLLPHSTLLARVWGADFPATTDNLKVLVSRLRAKLEVPGGPRYIQTERGVGYRFVRPRAAAADYVGAPPERASSPAQRDRPPVGSR